MCGYILELESVPFCFQITVTLTSVLSSANHVQSISPISLRYESQYVGVLMHLGVEKCHVLVLGHCDHDLCSRKIMSGAYLQYCMR